MEKLLTIGQASQMLGVCADTLRKTTKVQPVRTPGGHRRYMLKDILKLIESDLYNTETTLQVLRSHFEYNGLEKSYKVKPIEVTVHA